MTRSRRWSSYPHSFHIGFLLKQNILHHPRSNLSNVRLATKMLFSTVVEIQRCPYTIYLCKKENSATDIPVTPTLEYKRKDSTYEHESFAFETPFDSCSLLESPKLVLLRATCFYEDRNHLLILISKLFKRMVVDAFVYHKYCKSHICTVALTLQFEHYC